MNKLWVFGDSYSEPFYKENNMQWKKAYILWKGYTPKCYGETISESLRLKHINCAIGGADNYTIFDSIIENLEKIKSNDVIIIGWSHTLRFRVVNKNNTFNTIRPSSLETVFRINHQSPYLDLSDNTLKEITLNRNGNVYIQELNNYIYLLNFIFKKNKIIHWSPFRQDIDGLHTTYKSVSKLELVKEETKSVIEDSHFSESGHNCLSNEFINIINNYDSFKINKVLI